ncbi:hypothetical protein [Frigoriglobus tundricola]|uniref:Uncharacterized protein n=1 Tax=Frigoriglobus tundricola TaxID=2774151 RepID=A0A6M5YMV8_9BACT|nr:hypothetical protein [Frigoriglobus tundricola]QJW94686.1 hypothetical protein FTUN_2208 [Frigoriglobus tundricola]
MSVIVTQRCHRLADSLAELKIKVRAALATELAGAIGTAVRDVLVVALVDRLITPTRSVPAQTPPRTTGWRDDEDDRERDEWGYTKDRWGEPDDDPRERPRSRYEPEEADEVDTTPAVPTAAAVAVGVNVGRWWLAKKGSVPAAIGFGVLATGLGLAGGPVARAALAVLAAAADILVAESALARIDPS